MTAQIASGAVAAYPVCRAAHYTAQLPGVLTPFSVNIDHEVTGLRNQTALCIRLINTRQMRGRLPCIFNAAKKNQADVITQGNNLRNNARSSRRGLAKLSGMSGQWPSLVNLTNPGLGQTVGLTLSR
jgi:hypothetical protein